MRLPATIPPMFRRFVATNRWAWAVAAQTLAGTWRDGFTNAGNLAYLSLLALFPFLILLALVAGVFGATQDGMHAVAIFLGGLPLPVAASLRGPIDSVIGSSTTEATWLLTLSLGVMLWTISSTIEAIREIIYRAYQTEAGMAFWRTRLSSILVVFAGVALILLALAFQVALTTIETFVAQLLPRASAAIELIGVGRWAPVLLLLGSLYLVLLVLTPQRFRGPGMLIWPGAALTVAMWIGTTIVLPLMLVNLQGYDRTYGSLAGVIVTLLFFYIIGLGLVLGVHLNAALAIVPRLRQKRRHRAPIQGA
ncbi:MAG: YihY/virulence factor BrkB family protein [Polymorphobacter sp.]